MIRKPEVLRSYARFVPLEQVQFGSQIIGKIMARPDVFIPADLPVSALDLTQANATLSSKYADYKANGNSHKEAFLAAQLVWINAFNLTADYVELVAKGDGPNAGTIIQLSGFSITKTETTPAELPAQPIAKMEISNSARGEMSAAIKVVEGAKGYLFSAVSPDVQVVADGNQITVKLGNSFASFIVGTKRDVKFTHLPAIEVSAAVAAFNSAGLGTFSDPIDVKIP